jgi:peptidylprolyl isomerase
MSTIAKKGFMKPMFQTMFSKIVPLFCALALTACGGTAKKVTTAPIPDQPAYSKVDEVAGTGDTVAAGDLATVNYTGWLYDSTKPNSRGTQFETGSRSFAAGTGAVMPGTTYTLLGWDQGVVGMKVRGKANLVLPYNLAYGVTDYISPQSNIKVPAYTPVVFEVEVVSVKKASPSATQNIISEVAGTGAVAEYGKTLTIKYTAWYNTNGSNNKDTQYDTDTTGNYTLTLNSDPIKGRARGILGMKAGGKRTIVIPPELGYGNVAQTKTDSNNVTTTTVPANSTLVFDIELVSVK